MSTPSNTTDWVTIDQVIKYLGPDAPAADDADGQARLAESISVSSEMLYSLSGRQFPGLVDSIVRPTSRPEQTPDQVYGKWLYTGNYSYGWDAAWLWGACRGCGYRGCCGSYMIGLGRSPITDITSVQIDGVELDPSEYRVDDGKWLVRQNCSGWPTCQNLAAPLGEECTFSVSFTWGQDPPLAGQNAATILASEFYKAWTPGMACSLPARVTSITRQGVSFTILDPQTFMDKGLTGNYQIDLFLRAYNPARQIRRPMVWSPDMINQSRRTTWPIT
jgi:hypothetical protein